jgi:hypothetical protein
MVPDEILTAPLSVRVAELSTVPPFTVRVPLAFTVSALVTVNVPPVLTVRVAPVLALFMLTVAIEIADVMIG